MIYGCMNSLSQATPITLTDEERSELARLARSTRMEHRTRLKARIVLMAAEGAATQAIGRAPGCTTGTASKWRARYAKDRLAGFSEVGARGAEAKYDGKTDRRILALLDSPPPKGYANWSEPLIAKALGDAHVHVHVYVAICGAFCARKRSISRGARPIIDAHHSNIRFGAARLRPPFETPRDRVVAGRACRCASSAGRSPTPWPNT